MDYLINEIHISTHNLWDIKQEQADTSECFNVILF
jgi:hypothetical protein